MQRSKSTALLFLLCAFVAGIALGYTADRLMTREHPGRRQRPSVERMAKELDLTAAQRVQFDSIMAKSKVQMRALWEPLRPQMDSVQKTARVLGDSTHQQLKRVLNPDQAKKLDEMRERARKHSQDRARSDSNRNRPPPVP